MNGGVLPFSIALLGLLVAVTPLVTRLLGRASGWPLAAAYLGVAALLAPAAGRVLDGEPVTWSRAWFPALDSSFALRADGLGVVFAAIALVIGAVVLAYATSYLGEGRQTSFYWLMTAFTFAMVGLVLADDLVLLFLCWELTSLASFLLIARSGTSAEGASMRTLLITGLGGLFLLAAVAAIVARLGTTSLHEVLDSPVWAEDPAFATLVAVLVGLAAFTKSAQVPFHVWLPDAMAAITPVSAYLHAAAVVKAGIFLMLRFSPALHDVVAWNVLLVVGGLLTALVGGFTAIRQQDLKKLMACSTVSQLGFITAAIGVGTYHALAAAVLHTIAHALFKSGLFMMVGVVDGAAGTRELTRIPRLVSQMPVSFAVMVLGCASMAGIPPMLGFLSKEELLAAYGETPGGQLAGVVALAVGALGAVMTFVYCGRVVFGSFVDGTSDREIKPVSPVMIGMAALPIVVGLPLALAVGVLDTTVGAATQAAVGGPLEDPIHLALWHGFTLELFISVGIIAVGALLVANRRRLTPFVDGRRLAPDSATVIGAIRDGLARVGDLAARGVRADHPSRHVSINTAAVSVVLLGGVIAVRDDLAAQPLQDNLMRPFDAVVLVLMALSVLGVAVSRTRLAATLCLSGVGILATAQIMALGAPDVGLTQLLVESLTIIVIMLVLQKLPTTFGNPRRDGHSRLLARIGLSVLSGVAMAAGTWALTSRRPRSDVAMYYLEEGPVETEGANIVNTILVEFRALDTLGELAVLAMAGVAVVAVLSSLRHEYLDPPPAKNRWYVKPPEVTLTGKGTTAYRAIHRTWPNTVPLQLMVRFAAPVLVVISAYLFWRGHNAPGGGFIAALVGSAIVALMYLSTSRDRQLGRPRLPLFLIGGGILIAVASGLWGLLAKGSFLEPLHAEALGQHWTSSMVFDLGVYLGVLGLFLMTVNLLGTSEGEAPAPGEEWTRERVDEAFEGELPGPMDTVRGERADDHPGSRVGVRTHHVSQGVPPREVGR
ncbi:DUF4040 family protein [Marihabitans asiaticum]|uniref:Multisubunit sodium/proton antiporter MrpA subunit /multisubunit sodium/proton antiporter MrpB subunit n=1 Tax=Marihabitans asiaticum TaxID=415218 RepID=A0A560WDJ0_9MICO|nr:DUF4040 family protein [Marihabitans asiaticum]TWD15739.1 multisubunit sodium/proton antiporter MrpA subunit /multisubunit sodium/proton antiporter MrpB subunit [Marihabitans asiaticum]